ncbi:MAG: hypothetical protein DCC66_13440 [Planctomycetota bacterium]|nr:MAG: hypothetical protein DCC66_13440 [Planctomycetota bacterium]
MKHKTIEAPEHLRPATAEWWRSVIQDYALEPHHVRLLTLAAEAFDRAMEAREALAAAGSLTYQTARGEPKPRPEVAIERDARIGFARLLRELALDVNAPADEYSRPASAPMAPARKEVG